MRETDRFSTRGLPALVVHLPDGRVLRCEAPFHIGRDVECEVEIQDVHVSRRHAEVSFVRGQWVIRDLQSSNGLFVDGQRVETAGIGDGIDVSLGADGPLLRIGPEMSSGAATPGRDPASTEDSVMLEGYAERYFGSGSDEEVGGHTQMIRKAFQKVQQRQKRQHRWIITAIAVVALSAGGYAWYAHRRIVAQDALAQEQFYQMKTFNLRLAELEEKLAPSGSANDNPEVAKYMATRRQMEADYEKYVTRLYDRRLNQKDRLILRVTRIFGECEVGAPPGPLREVSSYIDKWKTTGRFARAVKLAQDRGYTKRIAAEFMAKDLPPQFFYLAMQESDFEPFQSGKPTRWGIAKGMWQFIPDTGKRYGLTIGPLQASPRPDLNDDRMNWQKSTVAATRYIKDLYATDAQASGLLVVASYNWGEQRVIDLLKKMPANPRERNFWKLLEQYGARVPPETYNYVFYIVSAAVIGENPRLFGFDFDNPLLGLGQN